MDKEDLKDLIAILANITKVCENLDMRLTKLEEQKNAVEKREIEKSDQ